MRALRFFIVITKCTWKQVSRRSLQCDSRLPQDIRKVMNLSKYVAKTLVWASLCGTTIMWSQTDEPEPPKVALSEQVLQLIPPGYREEVESLHLTATESDQRRL